MTDVAIAENAGAPEGTSQGRDRRAHTRLRAEELTTLGARLTSGAEIRLVDLSRGGAQFECHRRFLPNSTLSLRLVTPDTTFVVTGRVVRSRIVRLTEGGLGYNVAVAFNEVLQNLLEEPTAAKETSVAGTSDDASAPVEDTPAGDPAGVIAPEVETAAEAALASSGAASDITAEEAAAFEAAAQTAPAGFMVTASVEQTGEELRDLFNGNDW